MLDPQTIKVLNDLAETYSDLKLKDVEALTPEQLRHLKKLADSAPAIEELVDTYRAWKGFFKIGRYIFWFIIGCLMLITYYKDLILEGVRRWVG
jgi:hypothetical protein